MKAIIALIAFFFFLFCSYSPSLAVELLSDGFESSIESWSSSGGGTTATASAELARTGTYSLKVQHDKTSSYGFQKIISSTEGGMFYKASGYGKTTDANVASYFIRVAWYSSTDGSGSQLSSTNDSNSATTINGDWALLATDSIQAPSSANSAKVRLVLTSVSSGQTAYAYFDDVLFEESIAPTSTPTPTPSPTNTPTPTKTPTPTPTPIPNTPTSMTTPTQKPLPTSILGESTESALFVSPTDAIKKKNAPISNKVKSASNIFQKIAIGIGGIFLIFCAILFFRFYIKNKQHDSETL